MNLIIIINIYSIIMWYHDFNSLLEQLRPFEHLVVAKKKIVKLVQQICYRCINMLLHNHTYVHTYINRVQH